jgi:DHA2 family multidrug resistance protein
MKRAGCLPPIAARCFLGCRSQIWVAVQDGYKRFLLATIVLFAAASIGCALSPDLDSMLIWRAIQGLAGAGLVVGWRASMYVLLRPSANAVRP